MKWYKHPTNFRNSQIGATLLELYGMKGYAMHCILVEMLMAEKPSKDEPACLAFAPKLWCKCLRTKEQLLRSWLATSEQLGSTHASESNGLISITLLSDGNYSHKDATSSSDRYHLAGLNRTEQNRIEQSKKKKTKSVDLEVKEGLKKIEAWYQETYPRKEGKKKGMEYFGALLKKTSKSNLEHLLGGIRESIVCYAERCKKTDTETEYIKQFSSFARCYEDYLDPDFAKETKSIKGKGATGFDAIDVSDLSMGPDRDPF